MAEEMRMGSSGLSYLEHSDPEAFFTEIRRSLAASDLASRHAARWNESFFPLWLLAWFHRETPVDGMPDEERRRRRQAAYIEVRPPARLHFVTLYERTLARIAEMKPRMPPDQLARVLGYEAACLELLQEDDTGLSSALLIPDCLDDAERWAEQSGERAFLIGADIQNRNGLYHFLGSDAAHLHYVAFARLFQRVLFEAGLDAKIIPFRERSSSPDFTALVVGDVTQGQIDDVVRRLRREARRYAETTEAMQLHRDGTPDRMVRLSQLVNRKWPRNPNCVGTDLFVVGAPLSAPKSMYLAIELEKTHWATMAGPREGYG